MSSEVRWPPDGDDSGHAAADGEEIIFQAGDQEVSVSWHPAPLAPAGTPHRSPMFEIRHRKLVPAEELFRHLTIQGGYRAVYRRAVREIGRP